MWFGLSAALAATVEISPGDDLWAALDATQPGDDVVVHAGTYSGFDGSTWHRRVELHGSADGRITVRAADGEAVVIEGDPAASENIVDISGEWYTWSGFEMRYGSHGVRVGQSDHATFEDLEIHDTADVGLSMNRDGQGYTHMTVRRVHVYDTAGTGECFYLGCNEAACAVADSLVEQNWCHDTLAGEQGDGIELKIGSSGNVIRHNVVHDTRSPGINVSSTGGGAVNEIYGNVVWNTEDNGIQIIGQARVSANLVFSVAAYGIYSSSSQEEAPTDLQVVNNTVLRAGAGCFRANDWDQGGADLLVANNALLCDGGAAVRLGSDPGGAVFRNNAVAGDSDAPEGDMPAAEAAVTDPDALDAWPSDGSTLIDAGDAAYVPETDFNCAAWGSAPEVGAYAWSDGGNPGWRVGEGFKTCVGETPEDTGDQGDGAACGCVAAPAGAGWAWLGVAGVLAARRRRPRPG